MTTETNFTPGPWVLEDNPTVNGQQVAAFEKSGDMAGNRCLQVIVRSNNAADASLIAAAPWLYEALEAMVDRYAPSYHDCTDNGLPECEICDARAALAKARGEA